MIDRRNVRRVRDVPLLHGYRRQAWCDAECRLSAPARLAALSCIAIASRIASAAVITLGALPLIVYRISSSFGSTPRAGAARTAHRPAARHTHPVIDMHVAWRDESAEDVSACRRRRNDANRAGMAMLPSLHCRTFAFSAFGGREGDRAQA